MSIRESKGKCYRQKVIVWLMYLIYGIACMYLYYMQAIQPVDGSSRIYESDLPAHISMIVDDGWYYSITAYIYRFLYVLAGNKGTLIAVFLACISILTLVVTEAFINKIHQENSRIASGIEALMLNLVMAFYFPIAGKFRYVSYQNGNLWHNSTYICMRFVALLSMLVFIELINNRDEKIINKKWLLFLVLLAVGTGVKPSFLTVFAPTLACKLLWDLFHKVQFGKLFWLGFTVIPSCLIMLWQNMVLFGSETESSIVLRPWFNFSLHADRPKIAVLCSLAFPILIFIFWIREKIHDENYVFAWGMIFVGFMEALLLSETGYRERAGNFLWGYLFAIFYLYLHSFGIWREKYIFALTKGKTAWKQWIPVILCGLVFAYQLYGGIYFFLQLLSGVTYFM